MTQEIVIDTNKAIKDDVQPPKIIEKLKKMMLRRKSSEASIKHEVTDDPSTNERQKLLKVIQKQIFLD